jgi:hypothetical protein
MQKVISKKEIKKSISNKNVLNEKTLRIKELKELSEGLQNLNEATWGERFKYLAAKYLPSYKVGDKILGGSKERARLQAEIQKLIDAEAEGFLKALNSDIGKNFPNNLEKEEFLNGVLKISAVYDSIIAATQRPNNPLTPDQANIYIDNLRKYVNFMMSAKLNRTIYSTMNESEDIHLGEATMADIQGGLSSKSVQRALGADRVARGGIEGEDEFESDVMKGLNSNRLVKYLLGGGATLLAFGWISQTDWLKDILEYLFNKETVVYKDVYEKFLNKLTFSVDSGDGFTQTVNDTLGLNLGPNTTTDQFLSLMKQKGFGSTAEAIVRNYGIGGLSPNPRFVGDAALALNQKGALLSNVFEGIMHGKGGTLMAVNPGPFIATQILGRFVKIAVIKTTTTGTAMALGLAAAGPYLVAAGIALITTGAIVKLMRIKGKSSSRAATLNSLLQSLRDISNPNAVVATGGGSQGGGVTTSVSTTTGGTTTTGGGTGGGVTTSGGTTSTGSTATPPKKTPLSNLSKVLRNLFSNVYNVRQTLITEKAEKRPNYIKSKGLTDIGIQLDKSDNSIFVGNMKRMMAVAKAINKFDTTKVDDDSLIRLIQNVKQNGLHAIMTDINDYIDNEKVSNPDSIKPFIIAYNEAVKSAEFANLKAEIDKNLDTVLESRKPTAKTIEQLTESIKNYFVALFKLFKKVNELTAKENSSNSATPTTKITPPSVLAASPSTKPSSEPVTNKPKLGGGKFTSNPNVSGDKFKSKFTEAEELEESKKKNKYSKKASEFIGKEISHLKKDKKFPQKKAVAAAINIAKEKGMKVGSKKPKAKSK